MATNPEFQVYVSPDLPEVWLVRESYHPTRIEGVVTGEQSYWWEIPPVAQAYRERQEHFPSNSRAYRISRLVEPLILKMLGLAPS